VGVCIVRRKWAVLLSWIAKVCVCVCVGGAGGLGLSILGVGLSDPQTGFECLNIYIKTITQGGAAELSKRSVVHNVKSGGYFGSFSIAPTSKK
jgi:hypothetical protein